MDGWDGQTDGHPHGRAFLVYSECEHYPNPNADPDKTMPNSKLPIVTSPTEGEGDILFLVRIPLASAQALVLA